MKPRLSDRLKSSSFSSSLFLDLLVHDRVDRTSDWSSGSTGCKLELDVDRTRINSWLIESLDASLIKSSNLTLEFLISPQSHFTPILFNPILISLHLFTWDHRSSICELCLILLNFLGLGFRQSWILRWTKPLIHIPYIM